MTQPNRTASLQTRNGSTSVTILEIAERQFGNYGVEGVSIRQIGLEAKAANKKVNSKAMRLMNPSIGRRGRGSSLNFWE